VDLARLLAHRTAPTRRRQRPARAFEHVRAKEAFFAVPGNSLHLHVVGHGGSANGSNRQRQANGRCALRTHSLGAPLPALHGLGTRPDGGVVTQRTANPCTPVRFRLGPPLPSSFSRTTARLNRPSARLPSLRLPRNGQKNGPAASGRAWKVWERMPERPARNGPAEVLHQMQKLHRLLRLTQRSS